MITLRPYQSAAIDALFQYWGQGGGNGLIVLPTGAGKSLVVAEIMRRILHNYPAMRIACVTHSRELIVQNFQELIKIWPDAPAGIYSAGVGRRDTRSKILFCGVQSVFARTKEIGQIDLLLVDEAHLIPRSSDTMYGKFIDGLRAMQPDMRIAGLTATPYRLDSGRLDEGRGSLFDTIVYEAKVTDLIEQGYLSPLISKASLARMDLAGIGTRAGEFIPAQVERAAMEGDLVHRAVAEMADLANDRRAWLVFCASVRHAEAVRDALREQGIPAESVDGGMSKGERDGIIVAFKRGDLRALTSVNVLSIGFNVPHVDMVALMRPTKSTGLYIQQVGRAFRTAPNKENALILDFAKVISMHGPVDAVSVGPSRGGAKGEKDAPHPDTVRAKECPDCQALAALNARECKVCGHEWIVEEKPKHEAEAQSDLGILSTERVPPQMLPVVDWRLDRHEKEGSPPSLRVTFMAGLQQYREWWAFERQGYARQKAQQRWIEHQGLLPFPKTVDEALARRHEIQIPQTISVKPNGRYFDITGRSFLPREQREKAA
ncbi:DEAD/DEAH box helicase [Tianweitania sediminis]|uniref:DEAD/DEAH box helicase family protein n=1 Tax=Tianweitania sediminis TaxID=1502156 RepID=A0A8J7RLN1_9HYPH|nr:DEAD/DEAH box helicase [Tianweitania sediminis]MBP0440666.1 DEAD/DEAH box helicase family protein [Tianweitania sediminis]